MTDSTAAIPTSEKRSAAWRAQLEERRAFLAALPEWDGATGEAAWHAWFTSLELLQNKVNESRNRFGTKVGLSKETGDKLFRDRDLKKNWLRWATVEKMLKQFEALDLKRWQELHSTTEQFIRSGAALPEPQHYSPARPVGSRRVDAAGYGKTVPDAETPEDAQDAVVSDPGEGGTVIDLTESASPALGTAAAGSPKRRQRRIAAVTLVTLAAAGAAVGGVLISDHVTAPTPEPCPGPAESSYTFSYPGAYSGPVYVRVCAALGSRASDYQLKLVWGPKHRKAELVGVGRGGEAVTFTKTSAGTSYPITVMVTPPAPLIYGMGAPAGSTNINSGWQR